MAITESFLIYGTESGKVSSTYHMLPALTCFEQVRHGIHVPFSVSCALKIEIFYMAEWSVLSGAELRHSAGIKSLHPNYLGTRLLFVDATNVGYLYNPVNAELSTIPAFPNTPRTVFWDTIDKNVILIHDGSEVHGYVYAPCTIKGPLVSLGLPHLPA